MKLNYKNTILIGFAFMSISLFWTMYDHHIPLVLFKYLENNTVIGFIMGWDNIIAVLMLPLFGSFSDKIATRHGRRMPFIIIGTLLSAFFLILTGLIDYFVPVSKDVTFYLILASLFFTLLSMSLYRSPAVALMPDITVKPLRSKANAIINLMGSIGGGVILLSIPMLTNLVVIEDPNTGDVTGVSGNVVRLFVITALLMILMVLVLFYTVDENKLARQKQEDDLKYNIEEEEEKQNEEVRPLTKSEKISLFLILASIFLWFMGYNAVTSAFSRYAVKKWGIIDESSLMLLVGFVGATLAFIPSAMLAAKLGRKKTILIGIVLLTATLGAATMLQGPDIFVYILLFTAGVAWACINVNSFPMIVELSKHSNVGKYTGYYYAFSMAAQSITPFFSGIFLDNFGYDTLFPYGAIFSGLAFFTMYFVRHGDAKPLLPKSKLELFDVDD